MILSRDKDPMGRAINDYLHLGKASRLRVISSMFDDDEIPVPHLFRSYEQMPPLERIAIDNVRGKVLDVGAGAGCHSIVLKERGHEVTCIDNSPLSCEAMTERGLSDVRCLDILEDEVNDKFDTVIMLMNGTGIAGTLEKLPELLAKVAGMLNPGGSILIDSSDLKYLYENEDGSFDINLNAAYYGQVDYHMAYKKTHGLPFNWLYADPESLKAAAEKAGLIFNIVAEGEHYDYLARLSR